MSKIHCVIFDDYQQVAAKMADWAQISDRVTLTCMREHIADRDALLEALRDATIIIAMRERTPLDRDLLSQLPALRLLITSGMRNAAIDIAAASELGIVVCGTSSDSAPPTEHTWALILSLARHLVQENNAFRHGGHWQQTLGTTLTGKRLGLIGLGKIGIQMATIARAFGMQVSAWSPHLTAEKAQAHGVDWCAEKQQLLASSDIVSLHMVLAPATAGLLSYDDLCQMKASAYLINTSRAGLIAPGALVRALKNGVIAAAAIDVFEQEPVAADDAYRQLPNLLATPHLGYVTDSNYQRYFPEALENIVGWLNHQPLRRLN
ncbi:D-2-hydroxyacid dehydrogenase family protein [Erwinia sp. V71]|uniref:D-2-hydroxyacid dehydrogenase family protein n=1 Tax=Erwinia sp. V71 TaxID=3369424 RepID=UPI003F5F9C53